MRWLFLIPFSTSLIMGYIAQKSTDEITYLCGAMAAVTLFLSLVMAPWQVQLLILIVAVVIARQFWLKFERNKLLDSENSLVLTGDRKNNKQSTDATVNESEETVTRKYRGANYEVKIPKINVTQIEREGKYRGADFRVRYLQKEQEKINEEE